MKKQYYSLTHVCCAWVLLAFMLAPFWGSSQSVLVTVGTGTNTTGSYNPGPTPYGTYYHDDKTHILYRASDIIDAGGFGGTITALAFNVSAVGGQTMNGFNISIGTTSATSIGGFVSGLTNIYSGSNVNTTTGWNTYTLSTPLVWNGTDNIVVGVCFDNGYYTTDHSVYYTSMSYNTTYSEYADSWAGPGCSISGGNVSLTSSRPNIRFTFLPPPANDAGVANILSPSLPTCDLDSIDIEVTINNLGSDTLNNCLVKWQIGSGSINTFNYTGAVAPLGGTDVVTLSTNNTFSNTDQLHVWTELPNGATDSIATNDNAYITVQTGLSGIYSIPGDYATLTAAATALNTFGVCDHVVFELDNGTYTEQVTFGAVLGVSEDATVTFTSASGDQDDVTIQYASTSQTDNWVINLNGSDWFTFEDLTIKNTATNIYANVFDFLNGADNNTIQDCHIIGGTIQSTYVGNYASNIYMSGVNMNNSILNNTIENGMSALYSYGVAATHANGLLIQGNTIKNAYYYTMYVYYTDGLNLIDNHITANSSLYVNAFGLYMWYGNNFNIIGNYIGANYNYGYAYPLYIYYCNGSNNPRSQISNNCIHAGAETSTSYGYYGMYMYYSGIFDMYNNTIIRRGASNYYGVVMGYGGLIRFKNNNIANLNGGYALYVPGAFTLTESDYNNLYTSTGTPFYYGVTTYSTLQAYSDATGLDQHSMQVNPDFQNAYACVTCSEELDGSGTPVSSITDDIEDNTRSLSTPDIGATEYVTGENFSLGPDSTLCATTHLVEAGPAQLVVWNVNGSFSAGQTYLLDASAGTPQDFDVIATVTTLYCGSGSDTVEYRLIPDAALDSSMHLCADETVTLEPGGGANATYSWSNNEVTSTIMVSEAGSYSVTKMEEGCESSAEIVVTKSTAVNMLDIEPCEDDAPVTLDATIPDGTSYAWSGGTAVTNPMNTFDEGGVYSVTATDDKGCVSVDTFTIAFLSEPIANATYTGTGGTAVMFSSATSQNIGANTTYLWTFNGSDTSSSSNPIYVFPWSATPVVYNVQLQVDNGCGIDNDAVNITIDPLGVIEVKANQTFAVFPNPANDVVYLRSSGEWNNLEVSVLDNTGRLVQSVKYNAANELIEMNTSELSSGSYIVKITSDLSNEVHALIIQ